VVETLLFNEKNCTEESITVGGKCIKYRSYENINYIENPVAKEHQILNIYIPVSYYEEKEINGYQKNTAPIFMPNQVGGYMPGHIVKPGLDQSGKINATFVALAKGMVVVSPGVRGRHMQNEEGKYIGIAPAAIVDLKAVVRYLRYNKDRLPAGDVEKIISNGTSAGGALSALLGASGNHSDYESYLEELGAAKARDDIFAASCYCPITNLENADSAYEWEFQDDFECNIERRQATKDGKDFTLVSVKELMSDIQKNYSKEIKKDFPQYLNSLDLKNSNGNVFSLVTEREGSFIDYLKEKIIESGQKELNITDHIECDAFTIERNIITDVDLNAFIKFRTRKKSVPAFDGINNITPENELFGTEDCEYAHFTRFAADNDPNRKGYLADKKRVGIMNPMEYIHSESDKALYYRIRHGAMDRDTSLAISAMLALGLSMNNVKVDYQLPWGISHAGDYDIDELFGWIESITK